MENGIRDKVFVKQGVFQKQDEIVGLRIVVQNQDL